MTKKTSRLKSWFPIRVLPLVFVSIALVSGCDDAPSRGNVANKAANGTPEKLVATDGRGSYDWTINQEGFFDIAKPPAFSFSNKLAGTEKRKELWPPGYANAQSTAAQSTAGTSSGIPGAWNRPEWMKDDVYNFFRRFAEPVSSDLALQIPSTQVLHPLGFDLSVDGTTLYTINAGSLQRIEVEKPDNVQSIPCSVKDAFGVLATSVREELLVCNANAITKISTIDGQPLATIEVPGKIANWIIDPKSSAVVAVTIDKELIWIDAKISQIHQCDVLLANDDFSISREGIISAKGAEWPIQWKPGEESTHLSQELMMGMQSTGNEKIEICSGDSIDYIISDLNITYSKRVAPEEQERAFWMQRMVQSEGMPNSRSHFLTDTKSFLLQDSRAEWLMIVGQTMRPNGGKPEYVLMDVMNNDYGLARSHPLVIGDRPLRMLTSSNGETLAILQEKRLSILKRSAWAGSIVEMSLSRVANLLVEQRDFEQLEQCAAEVRKRDWPHHGFWGEQIYESFANEVGKSLNRIATKSKSNASSPETQSLSKIKQWRDSKSELACMAFSFQKREEFETKQREATAEHFRKMGASFLFRNSSDPRTDAPQIDGTPYLETANLWNDKLLALEKPPAIAFVWQLQAAQARKAPAAEQELIVQRCMSLYPQLISINICDLSWRLMQSDGEANLISTYANTIADLYAPEVRDDALVWLLGQVQASELKRWFETDSGQVDFERWRDVLRKWMRQGHAWNAQGIFESSLGFRDVNVDMPLWTEIANHVIEKYPIRSEMVNPRLRYTIEQQKMQLMK
jgi:hypothetical protein